MKGVCLYSPTATVDPICMQVADPEPMFSVQTWMFETQKKRSAL